LGTDNPRWINGLLESRVTETAARIGLTSAYLIGGLTKLSDFDAAVAEQAHFGLSPARVWAILAIGTEILGPVLIISGRFLWLGAGALGVLTAVAMVVANDFWNLHGHARMVGINTFFEHLGLIAGCVLAAISARRDRCTGADQSGSVGRELKISDRARPLG
jgi:uncharacterized membrane protein YphA (DoxX/SURF4 family)